MGIFYFIKSQFIEVIEWTDSSDSTMVYRFPVLNNQIKMGAQLTVRESQMAVFVNEGKIADIFTSGLHSLSTQNLPVLTVMKSWKYGFNSPFKAEVYFVNMKQLVRQIKNSGCDCRSCEEPGWGPCGRWGWFGRWRSYRASDGWSNKFDLRTNRR